MESTQTRLRIGSGGLLYLLVSGLILASAIYTQANLLFWGFGLMVGGLILSIGAAAVALRGLEVTRIVPTHCAAGEALPLRYEIHNRSWLPAFAVVLRENWGKGSRGWRKVGPAAGADAKGRYGAVSGGVSGGAFGGGSGGTMLGGPPHAWVLHLGPRRHTQTQAPCRPRRRGTIAFERIEASTSFPFSVFHKTVIFEQADEVLVFPYLYRVRRQLMSNLSVADGDGRQTIDRGGGSEEFFGLREYRPGDGPRMIDWKRTARTGKLVSRELTMPSPPKMSLVLDLRETPPMAVGGKKRGDTGLVQAAANGRQLEERAISLTASMVCEAYLRGFRVGLRVLGPVCDPYRPRHSLLHRTRLLEGLAKLDLTQRHPVGSASDDVGRADIIIWAGRGTALPTKPITGTAGGVATVLGAADFDRYVTKVTKLDQMDQPGRHRPRNTNPRRHTINTAEPTAALPASDPAGMDQGAAEARTGAPQ